MSIENLTLAHFRHFRRFRHFSSLFINLSAYKALYLRAYKAPLHLSRILYKSPLFMQNKPNFKDAQMNLNFYNTMDYEKFLPLVGQKNKPNSNPNKPNFKKDKMNVNLTLTKDYRKKDDFTVRINKPNFRNGQNERKRFFTKGL